MNIINQLEEKYAVTLTNGKWVKLHFVEDVSAYVEVRYVSNQNQLEVSIEMELSYNDEITTQKLIDLNNQNITFYFSGSYYTLTKCYNLQPPSNLTLNDIETWLQDSYKQGI